MRARDLLAIVALVLTLIVLGVLVARSADEPQPTFYQRHAEVQL